MKKLILFLFTFFATSNTWAQRWTIPQYEVGAEVGLVNFQTDFSPKAIISDLATINGVAVNVTHYAHLLPWRYHTRKLFRHMMIKSSFGINYTSFNNFSKGGDDQPYYKIITNPDHPDGLEVGDFNYLAAPNDALLARLTAKTFIISLDFQAQYYFRDIIASLHKYNKYRNKSKFNPYLAIGGGINYVNSSYKYKDFDELAAKNAGGNNGLPDTFSATTLGPPTSKFVLSGSFSMGSRYKLNPSFDLVSELKIIYYLSDRIDSIDLDMPQNKFNDYNASASFGIIYHLF